MNFLNVVRKRMCLLEHRAVRLSKDFFTEHCRRASLCNLAAALIKSPGASAYIHGNFRCISSMVRYHGCKYTSVKTVCAIKPCHDIIGNFETNDARSRLRYYDTHYQHTSECRMDKCVSCCKAKAQSEMSKVGLNFQSEFVFSPSHASQRLCKSNVTFRNLQDNTKYSFDNIPSFMTPEMIRAKKVSMCTNFNFVRRFRVHHGQLAKDGHTHDGQENDVLEEEEEMEEWIHPDDRSDSILNKDPELKSLLRELASDFGKEKSTGNDADPVRDADDQGYPENKATDKMKGDVKIQILDHEGVETFEPIITEREGEHEKKFVFSIDDLVSVLREENAQDICVINIPKEKQYVDYFVVVTGRSPRHLRAMALHINQQYKSKKTKEDPYVLVEGEDTDDWICIDFGNIVLHIMSEETREFYELEKLWTLGPDYDDQLRRLKEYEIKMKETEESIDLARTGMEERQEESGDAKPVISFVR